MTHYRPQAHRSLRVPLWPLTLLLMVASAAVAVAVIWFAASLLFSMQRYVESLPL